MSSKFIKLAAGASLLGACVADDASNACCGDLAACCLAMLASGF